MSLNEFDFVHSVTLCGLEIFGMATLCFLKKVVFFWRAGRIHKAVFLKLEVLRRPLVSKTIPRERTVFLRSLFLVSLWQKSQLIGESLQAITVESQKDRKD